MIEEGFANETVFELDLENDGLEKVTELHLPAGSVCGSSFGK